MVGVPGIEPGTSSMSTRRSPAELYALFRRNRRRAGEVAPPGGFFKPSRSSAWPASAAQRESMESTSSTRWRRWKGLERIDRQSVGAAKSGSCSVDLGGGRIINTKKKG